MFDGTQFSSLWPHLVACEQLHSTDNRNVESIDTKGMDDKLIIHI